MSEHLRSCPSGVLQTGDYVLKIDGRDTQGRIHSELVDLVMGPPGSVVELVVERETDGTILTVEVRRETTARRDSRAMVQRSGDISCIHVHMCGALLK